MGGWEGEWMRVSGGVGEGEWMRVSVGGGLGDWGVWTSPPVGGLVDEG